MIEFVKPSVLALWLISMESDLRPISVNETQWAENLPFRKARQFKHSRGYIRESLSELFNIPALEIPLNAPPGEPPKLPTGWGNISLSHCYDCLFIGWSPERIGVDIERSDRDFKVDQLIKRFFSRLETKKLMHLSKEERKFEVLKQWVIKEAAIKWQRGSIIRDFSKWKFYPNSNQVIHQSMGDEADLCFLSYHYWLMGVALEKDTHNSKPIFCQKVIPER